MKYEWTSHAKEDLRHAAAYYDSQREGLGAEFIVEVGIGIARILDAPMCWPEIEQDVKKYRLDRFPFGILYHLPNAHKIQIAAIFDLRRLPGSWRR